MALRTALLQLRVLVAFTTEADPAQLGEFGQLTSRDIGELSQMHKTKVSRAVALLEKRKLVARQTNRADLRESLLMLTPAGRAMYEELAPVALDFAERLSEVMDPADRAAFERSVDRLTERSAMLAQHAARGQVEESSSVSSKS